MCRCGPTLLELLKGRDDCLYKYSKLKTAGSKCLKSEWYCNTVVTCTVTASVMSQAGALHNVLLDFTLQVDL